ncbi:AAA family ATPase [Ligilactobacillus equi]|uniref:AAA family ATPase n=1 Tax=Ligilactobacillus equi TaxID=137357 RepID=UPI000469EAD0|nr:AAA family ATPase [Ligilactobacillus equi]
MTEIKKSDDVEQEMNDLRLVIPADIDEKYNYSMSKVEASNVLVGYEDTLLKINQKLEQVMTRNIILVGPQGVGKTATVEKFTYDHLQSQTPALVIRVAIESIGALPGRTMVSRMESLMRDLVKIEYQTLISNYDEYEKIDVTGMTETEVEKVINSTPHALVSVYDKVFFKANKISLLGLSSKEIKDLLIDNKGERIQTDVLHLENEQIDLSVLSDVQIDVLLKQNPTAERVQTDTFSLSVKEEDGKFTLDGKSLSKKALETLQEHNQENFESYTRSVVINNRYDLAIFIDEVHKLNNYGESAKGQGSSGAMNALKEGMARGKAKLITATTDYEYKNSIAKDGAFERRFSNVVLVPPTDEVTVQIVKSQLADLTKKWDYIPKFSDGIIKEIVTLSTQLISNQPQPAKSLAVMDAICGICREEYHRTGEKRDVTHQDVVEAFAGVGIKIDLNINSRHVQKVIRRRVKGQPLAINTMVGTARKARFTKRDYRKPIMTLLLVGTTGIGKTESVKSLAEAIFGREDAILTLNGGDYLTPEAVTEATQFIGDSVQTDKSRIILIDEIEKADKNMAKACMRLIDDGIVRDSHGVERSLSSCIVIATSNLGASQIAKSAEAMHLDEIDTPDVLTASLEEQWRDQSMNIQNALVTGNEGENNGLPPEFLQRFSIIPFFPLQPTSFATIANIKLNKFADEERELGFDVKIPESLTSEEWSNYGLDFKRFNNVDIVSVMIAKDIISKDAKNIGARAINNYINDTIKGKLSVAVEYRLEENLPMDGYFTINTNGNSLAETTSNKMASVMVTYTDTDESVWIVDEYHFVDKEMTIPVYRDVSGMKRSDIWDLITDESAKDENVESKISNTDFFANY